jgi:hypothetical protein
MLVKLIAATGLNLQEVIRTIKEPTGRSPTMDIDARGISPFLPLGFVSLFDQRIASTPTESEHAKHYSLVILTIQCDFALINTLRLRTSLNVTQILLGAAPAVITSGTIVEWSQVLHTGGLIPGEWRTMVVQELFSKGIAEL